MLFKKLFRLLVLGGAIVGSASGCAAAAQGAGDAEKKPEGRDAGASADAGSASAGVDAGSPADAGGGGGVLGW